MKFALYLIFLHVLLIQTEELTREQYTLDHDKNYKEEREESSRFSIFRETLKNLRNLNTFYRSEKVSYTLGINDEMTEKEFADRLNTNRKLDFSKFGTSEMNVPPNLRMPTSLDWRDMEGVVPEVPELTECNAAWAINVIDSIEAQNVILYDNHTKLSVQEVVDCADLGEYNSGCDGGSVDSAFEYVLNRGVFPNSTYPWLGETTSLCANYEETTNKIRIAGVKRVTNDVTVLQMALAYVGPMVALIDARFIQNYNGSDVYYENDCLAADETTINHPVLVVGYGSGHWIVRNSWGTSWGDEGYLKLTNVVHHDCGLTSHVLYPILESAGRRDD